MNSKLSNASQVKLGAIISYILIVANALYGLIVTPLILDTLGTSSYGVYKTVTSFTSAIMVLDFGLGGTIMRYISKYVANKEEKKIDPFVSMALCETGIIILLVAIVSTIIYFNIELLYSDSFNGKELILAKTLFIFLALNVAFHMLENVLNGIITGFNNFVLGNGIKGFRFSIRVILILLLLPKTHSAVTLVSIDLFLTIATVLVEYIYIKKSYKIKISYKNWDGKVFKESFIYTFLLFLTTIAAEVNGNLDNAVIGAIKGANQVAIYSFGLLIFGMFEQLSCAISGVMLPTVSKIIAVDKTYEKVQKLIVKVGRIQFALLGAAVLGFSVLGKEFISLWLGKGFEDVYIMVLILIIPATFELCVNVCLSVLRAKNKLVFRTVILISTTIFNFLFTLIGVRYWNYFAAAIGTALSFIIGSLIIMNIYYYKILGFNMIKIYKSIMSKIWICLLVATVAIIISNRFLNGSWIFFVINVLIFCVVYAVGLLIYGLNKEEKTNIRFLNKMIKK